MEALHHPLTIGYRSNELATAYAFAQELEQLKSGFERVSYRRGDILFRECSSAWGLYYIESGKIKLYKIGSDGKEQIIKIAHQGEFVGYTSVLHDTKYNTSAAVLEDAVLTFIPKQDFLDAFGHSSSVAQHFTALLCQDVVEAEQRITAMAYRPVRGRLAEALLSLDKIYEQEDEREESFICLSRQDLASLLGTAKETVIRLLSEFRQELLISTDGTRISVLNPQGLMKISHLYD